MPLIAFLIATPALPTAAAFLVGGAALMVLGAVLMRQRR
jgi:hypothetical protein